MVEDTLAAGKVKHIKNFIDGFAPIFGDDANGVSGRISHALFERQLDVPRLFFRTLCRKQVVCQHPRLERAVTRVLRCCMTAGIDRCLKNLAHLLILSDFAVV